MPSFANPFQGNVDRKLTNAELMQALRLDIAGELEAIFLYDAHYLATDDPVAKAVLADIRDEEKVHMGELITLMRHLDPREAESGSSWRSWGSPERAFPHPPPGPRSAAWWKNNWKGV